MTKLKKHKSDFRFLPVEIIILGGHFFFLCLDGRNWRILDFHILNHFYSQKVSFSGKRQNEKWSSDGILDYSQGAEYFGSGVAEKIEISEIEKMRYFTKQIAKPKIKSN